MEILAGLGKLFFLLLEILGGILVTVVFPIFVYLFKKQESRIDMAHSKIDTLVTRHETDKSADLERCRTIHDREAAIIAQMATKTDLRELRSDMNDNFAEVNKNILSIARG